MMRRLWPKGLIGQLVVTIAVALFVAQAVNFVMLAKGQKEQAIAHGGGMIVARIVDGVERDRKGDFVGAEHEVALLNMREEPRDGMFRGEGRRERAEHMRRSGSDMRGADRRGPMADATGFPVAENMNFRLRISDAPYAPPSSSRAMPDVAEHVTHRLKEAGLEAKSVRAWVVPEPEAAQAADFRGKLLLVTADVDGRHYTARGRLPPTGSGLHGFLVWQTLTIYLLVLVPILFIAWRAAGPLRQLTQAARSTPMRRDSEVIAEKGPSDVRELIRAFNAYRARIDLMLTDKDRMLGAVGHDLRTPLASLRVRVEQVDNDKLRDKMIASIDEMTAMLTDILALARSGAGTEEAEQLDAAALMQEMAADFQEQGKDVTLADLKQMAVTARPMLVRRALRNLISNAGAYGVRARLSLREEKGFAAFIISDDGPGMTAEQIKLLVEPFARGEESRNRQTGGSGLGLSIARDIAEGEGGRLDLRSRDGGGLDAVILLPLTKA
jgi:signal transduction histidine kinase